MIIARRIPISSVTVRTPDSMWWIGQWATALSTNFILSFDGQLDMILTRTAVSLPPCYRSSRVPVESGQTRPLPGKLFGSNVLQGHMWTARVTCEPFNGSDSCVIMSCPLITLDRETRGFPLLILVCMLAVRPNLAPTQTPLKLY